jgi:RimJ/RimL family protein N-acetyltransferase
MPNPASHGPERHVTLKLEIAGSERLAGFVEVLEEVGTWLFERGIPQWPPGSNRAQSEDFRAWIDEGDLIVLRDGYTVLGGCIVGRASYEAWDGHPDPAAYLRKLAVARSVGGRNHGHEIVERAEQWAREADRTLIRLDCWDGSQPLRAYYRDLDFVELGRAKEHGYWVRLFEKAI